MKEIRSKDDQSMNQCLPTESEPVEKASNNRASKRKMQGRVAREKNREQKRDESRLSLRVGRRSRVCRMVFSATASPRILQTQTLLWSLPLAFLAPVW